MGVIDIVLLIVIGVFGIKGLFRGLISEVFGILGLILGYVLAYQYYGIFAKIISGFGIKRSVADALGFVITFLLIYIVIFLIGTLLRKFFKTIKLGWMDKTGGFAFGVIKASVILGVLLYFLISVLPPSVAMSKDLKKSPVAKSFMKVTPYVFDMLNKLPKEKKRNPFKGIKF
ncbi:CvpA family protein [Deferribacter autotrophicus]|uniref:CvpA family protein n=1 Tax=Deferribacter autotrophicus TaxID=500465 RepID=A0A5A8F4U9_9BACT|nr:CvpA family protein [Deferribacter autotrophicus]KAA0258085.1 CvpA family protein [Deferribacter autotrophicus]